MRSATALAAFPPSRRVSSRVHACGGGIYLLSGPDSAEQPDLVWAVGWAESDYWAERVWTVPFEGSLEPSAQQWHPVPSLAFLGKPDDLSFGSVRAFEHAQEGARKALVTAAFRISDGAVLSVAIKGLNGVTYRYGSNNPKAKDRPVAIEIRLPGEPVEEVVLYRREGAPPLDSMPLDYATSSAVVPGPHWEYPDRDPAAASAHAQVYEEQRIRLQAALEAQGRAEDLFVAKVFAVRRPDGGAHTYTTWTEGIATLLPPADVVLLAEQPAEAGGEPRFTWVRWDVTAQVCADHCWQVRSGYKPPRILTVRWPAAEQLEVLKSRKLR